MNKAVSTILNKILGNYVEDLNSKQLSLSILKGELELDKVKLRRDIFNDIGYPFNLKYGYIEHLSIRIPWTSLASSPIQIVITGIFALITPLDSSEWNEDTERINQDKNKFKQLEDFETSIATQISINKIPNFVQRLVGKIVDNIQINISSIYIKYEDSITSNESYSMGFLLKELSVHTTSKTGKLEFTSYKDSSHKLILLDNACFFVDYGNENVITNRLEDFELIAKLEMEIPQKHRFLLRPISFRVTLDINKNNKRLDAPQINANLICGGIGVALEAKQLTHCLKLMEFLRVFDNWQKGIEIHRQEFDFTYSEELMYRLAYKKWRIHQTDELRRNLDEFEKGHSLEAILNSRKAASREFDEQWAEKAAKEKVSDKGTLSAIKDFFTGEKEEDNLDEENKLVDKMLSEKNQLSTEIETFVMDSDIFHDMPDDFIRFKFSAHVNIILFSLRDEESELTLYTMMHPSIEIGIRPLTKFLKAKIESLSLEDRYLNSEHFQNILIGESLLLEFDQFPSVRLKIDIKLLQFCVNFETLLKIADEFKTKTGSEIDFSPYMKTIETKTQELAEQGEKYVQDLLKTKVPTPIILDISIKAPIFFIPMNPRNIDEGMIVIDMGYLKGATSEEKISNYDFDKYLIALENIEIFMVWNTDNLDNWRKGKIKAILPSVEFNIFIYVCHVYQRDVPGYILAIHAGLVSFILEQAVLKWILRLLAKITEKTPPGPDIKKIEEVKEKEEQKEKGKPVQQTEAIKDKLKRIEDSASLQVSVEFEEISLKLIKDEIDLVSSIVSRTKIEFIFGSQGDIDFDFQLKFVEIKDLRPNVKLRYAIINPLLFDRSVDLDSNITFFAVKFKFKPRDDLIELDVNISGIRLMPSTDFISEIIQFFTVPIQDNFPKTEEKYDYQEKEKTMEKPPVSKYTTKSIIKISINLHRFELLIPLDIYDISKRIGCFRFGVSIIYSSCQEYTRIFDKFRAELSKEILHANDEGSIEITGISIFIGLVKNNLVHHTSENAKDIISPSRLSLVYQFIKTDNSEAAMTFYLNIESFCIDIGFRDIFFGKLLVDLWLMLDTGVPKEEKKSQKPEPESENQQEDWIQKASKIAPIIKFYIESDAFQLTLIDDTTNNAYPLLYFHMSNFSIFAFLENFAMNSGFSSFLFIDYYNLQLASWEPLMEEWNFQLTGEQSNSSSVMILKFESSQILNVNFTIALLDIVKILMSHSDSSQWREEKAAEIFVTEEKLAHGHYSYEIHNELGKNIQIWLDTPSENEEVWTLNSQEHLSFEQNLVKKMVAQSRPKGAKLGLLDFGTPSTISVKMDNDNIYRGILIESAGVSGYKFKKNNVEFIIDIALSDDKKIIKCQSEVLIANETKESIKINLDDEYITIEGESAFPLPLTWFESDKKPSICGLDEKIWIFEEGSLKIGENKWIVVKSDFYKTNTHIKQKIINIKYPFTFRNLLACPVEVYLNSSADPIYILPIGEDFSTLKLDPRNPSHSYKFLLNAENEKHLETNWFSLSQTSAKTHTDLRGNYIGNTLSIETTDFLYTPWENFHLSPRKISKRENEKAAPLNAKLVEIYSKYLLVNKTDFALDLGYSKIVLPPHSNGFMKYGKKLKVRIARTDTTRPSSWSNKFSINAIGISGVIELNNWKLSQDEPDTIIIGVSIIDGPSPLFKSKIIYFCPRFIISNHLGYDVFIRQRHKRAGQTIQEIIYGSSIPYQLESAKLSRLIQVSRDKSAWSSPFNLERIDDFQIKLPSNEETSAADHWFEPSHNNCYMNFIRVVISSDDEACISISLLPPKDPEFRIRNYTDKEIIVNQPKFPTYLVPPGAMIPWAFDDIHGKRKIMIEYNDLKESYFIDKIEQMKDLGDCKVEVVAIGVTRELKISPANVNIVRLDTFFDSKKKGFKLLINFTGFGMSIIDNEPKEFLYISLKDMFGKISMTKKLVKDEAKNFTKFYFELGEFQIDNMKNTHKQFPVIFNSTIKAEKYPFMQLKLNKINSTKQISEIINVVKSIDNYSWIEITLQEMETHVNLETITDLANFIGKIQSALASPIKKGAEKDSLKDAIGALDYSTPVFNYEESNLTNKAYFQYLRLHPIRILISFRASKQKVEVSNDPKMGFGLFRAFASVGSAFINFSNSPFRFSELLIHHSFQSPQEIGKQITKFYTREGISQFYKILGSVDLLGNPIEFIDTLGKGVTDFFVEPSKKVMKGPKSFSRGVGKGVRSLVGNTISGSFGGVNRITGSLYGIVREMTGDQYGSSRIENEGKVLGSLYKGMKGSVQDLSEGITGVVVKPYRGAKKKGAGGCFKGFGSGLVSLACSPVSAALRLGTGITGCAANAGTVIAKGRTTAAKRVRFPRYFGVKKVLEQYNHDISRAQFLMSSLPDYRKEKIVYYSHLIDFEDQIILLTMNDLLVLVNSELAHTLSVDEIQILEIHSLSNIFVLYCGNEDNTVSLRSREFSPLVKLYSYISNLSTLRSSFKREQENEVEQ
ncbi:unnamed protein product [Blepharisma stoltei]|uniref:Vacuolar protein sorting-associated protein n=1 Tax=Blepharisma stoltei TaxID=1481888 RepID=A0AAU9IVH8_9CILI|nr:unnamed protein product [Blepharisma stoltei]